MVDIGTNSTRLLVADVVDGRVREVERRSTVTRLGRGVDTSKQLSAEAIDDVCRTVGDYIAIYEPLAPDRVIAIATSAVRDAENSAAFLAELRERFALDATMVDGSEEAQLTYLGACAEQPTAESTLVIDIGGGSTELVVGSGSRVDWYASLQAGVVRHTERHLLHDPPRAAELEALAEDVRSLIAAELEGQPIAHTELGSRWRARRPRSPPSTRSWTPTTTTSCTATGCRCRRSSGCAPCSRQSRWQSAPRCRASTPTGRRRSWRGW